ncbi:cupin domain-containing protein [Actinospongicola halichondriae]|uniref:cupin domain-containing protein n=1 Tax=Actinospongicola halichondriae TaxID=3236844 RepID=UPI003D4001A4
MAAAPGVAEVVLPCIDLASTLQFFTDRLGFRVEVVFPADDPRVAVLSGHGTRIRLDPDASGDPGVVRLVVDDRTGEEIAPNGTRIVWGSDAMVLPDVVPSFTITRAGDDWGVGRAGMEYRDLISDRLGGRFIASHIRIAEGGPVPDWVHFHEIRFQLIVVRRGWVEVVYEDQGDPFVMEAGDCVLQPPEIRHRVLRSSDGLEVIEIGCPAEHRTVADHDLALPTDVVDASRDFGGQRFVRHVSSDRDGQTEPWRHGGFDAVETDIGDATDGLAGVRFVRPGAGGPVVPSTHAGEFAFGFVLDGAVTVVVDGEEHRLASGDCVTVPAGLEHAWTDPTADLHLLDVTLPAHL